MYAKRRGIGLIREKRLEFLFARLQCEHRVLHRGGIQSVLDRADGAGDPALYLGKLSLMAAARGVGLAA